MQEIECGIVELFELMNGDIDIDDSDYFDNESEDSYVEEHELSLASLGMSYIDFF